MKQRILYCTLILVLHVAFSCKKTAPVLNPGAPHPSDTIVNRSFRLVFEDLAKYSTVPAGLSAAITLEKDQQPDSVWNLSAAVVQDPQYRTLAIRLPENTYRIKKLILTDSNRIARFATPLTGSSKAGMVSRPLSISFALNCPAGQPVPVELLPVADSDTPESFGYPAGSFGNRDAGTPTDTYIFIHPIIRVGTIVYDSIPVQLTVQSWDARGALPPVIHYLPAGVQRLYLPSTALKHKLSVSKWGSHDELELTKADIREGTVYAMGGSIPAKKLKTVYEYKIVKGYSTPFTKTDFAYHPDGKLQQRLVWGKRSDLSNYLARKDLFDYTNGHITTISSYDEANKWMTTTLVQYNAVGKVVALEENSPVLQTRATANYIALDSRTGISQDYRIDVSYTYGHGLYTRNYSKTMRGGSVLSDILVTSNGNREEGSYDYDLSINPYVHLEIPDLLFTQYTKHNLKFQRKTWYGAYPEFEAYNFSYTYDEGGYPKELQTAYRSYQTKAAAYVIRTVFVYQE
ncbi:MAG: hypothetical protein J7599_14670 [Niabella sp.]|nr:hypothetical protein [Niabella sp.]